MQSATSGVGTIGGTVTTTNYSYDGDGKPVKKTVTTASTPTTTRYLYDAAGQLTAEYSTAANPDSGTQYLSQDHLGSTRLAMSLSVVNSQPTLGNVIARITCPSVRRFRALGTADRTISTIQARQPSSPARNEMPKQD
jgi:YD repeat-containing protein